MIRKKEIFGFSFRLCLGILAIYLASCTKTEDLDINPADSYQYFPIEVGDSKLYQKVTFSYAVGQKEKIDSVLVREIVTSKSKSNNETYYIIERQIKAKNDFFFRTESVYQVITNPKQIVNAERNIYTILLQFPLYLGAKWNLNEINGQDEKEVEVFDLEGFPKKLITDKDLLLVQSDSTNNLVDFKVANKVFAKNIGLIYTENTLIDYCQDSDPNPNTSCTGKYLIESGKREFWTLLEYGKKE